jgi:hypothetical protein
LARQRRRPLAIRLSRQTAQMELGALQRLRDRAALIACHSGDENVRSFVIAGLLFRTSFKLAQSGLSLQARLE